LRFSGEMLCQFYCCLTRQVISQAAVELAKHFSRESQASRELTLHCHRELVEVMVKGFTSQMQLMAERSLIQEHQLKQIDIKLDQMTEILQDIRQVLVHQQRFQANEDFLVGMQYLKHLRVQDAQQQFEKALAKFGGHYQSLLAMGYIEQQLYGDLEKAYDWFHKAYAQAGQDPTHSEEERRAERSFAAMYLARIVFTRKNYQAALGLYKEAYLNSEQKLFSALIEAAVCLFFLHSSAEAGKKVREDFGQSALCWYALALELSPYFEDHALEALEMALACDSRVHNPRTRNANWVWGILHHLNPRYVRKLRNLVKHKLDLAWLIKENNVGVFGDKPEYIKQSFSTVQKETWHIFARSLDNHLLEWWQVCNSSWCFSDLTNEVGGKLIAGKPFYFNDNGTQHIFVRGIDGHLLEWWWTQDNGWHLSDLTNEVGGKLIVGEPLYCNNNGIQHVFVKGKDGHLLEWWWDHTSGWHLFDLTNEVNDRLITIDFW